MITRRTPRTALLLAALLLLVACAPDGGTGAEETSGSEVGTVTGSEAMGDGSSMDMSGMDDMEMGTDVDATPAEELPDAELAEGDFTLLGTAPPSYGEVTGTAALARSDAGTTVTIRLEGLPAGTEFMSHVHEQSCDEDQGGAHFRFDPDGSELPPNEIHLPFTSDADGTGFMTAVNEQTAGPEARAVVVHPAATPDNRVACATLR